MNLNRVGNKQQGVNPFVFAVSTSIQCLVCHASLLSCLPMGNLDHGRGMWSEVLGRFHSAFPIQKQRAPSAGLKSPQNRQYSPNAKEEMVSIRELEPCRAVLPVLLQQG